MGRPTVSPVARSTGIGALTVILCVALALTSAAQPALEASGSIALSGGTTEWQMIAAADFIGDAGVDLHWRDPSGAKAIGVMNGTLFSGDARTRYGGSTEWWLAGRAP